MGKLRCSSSVVLCRLYTGWCFKYSRLKQSQLDDVSLPHVSLQLHVQYMLEYNYSCISTNDVGSSQNYMYIIELFLIPTLMHNSSFINNTHYYPRHVSSINTPIFRRKNCIHTASGIVAVCKQLHSTPVESGARSQPVCCAAKTLHVHEKESSEGERVP